ncbi:hypothetical protein CROQUDRAFT_657319 [Cronartium quercuum f. sp. fusiforme G11]|uniref:F-box domain-containing protein n=1 Tax=Cronartium quercuum f. sp. fusiforme G11 TaxID=708437 RepID=A0A9P6NIA7_9BASI|nr:hypothetical protein CROQUDRAFT_657319 [Cronartium quercuum f. sp. fusiforme G11]
MSSNHLLQEAVIRAAHQHDPTQSDLKTDSLLSPHKTNQTLITTSSNSSINDSDPEDITITQVHTPALIDSPPFVTPASSRPCSPSKPSHQSSSPSNPSRPNSRVGLRAKREAAAKAKASSSDPLLRFPNPINVRIFELVGLGSDGTGGSAGDIFSGVRDLMACGLVCQKWRTSATINFVWFKLCSATSYESSLVKVFEPPTWTRKDSKVDWSARYRIKNRIPDQTSHPDFELTSGPETLTANELKHQQWQQEEEERDGKFSNKLEARAFYKELGGRKLKNKTGKSLGTDRTGWDSLNLHQ